jgi:ribosomal protein S18 acetylase RimI-like enzyme
MPKFLDVFEDEDPWSLLLEADPSRERVKSYLDEGECFGMIEADKLIGVCVLRPQPENSVEIMNLVVEKTYRGRGYGKRLLEEAIERARTSGAKRIHLGTGNSSIHQLAFYQKAGFRISGVERDFFIDNYLEVPIENGILCRDMIYLTLELD